jgi:erythromycin esterase-like protein
MQRLLAFAASALLLATSACGAGGDRSAAARPTGAETGAPAPGSGGGAAGIAAAARAVTGAPGDYQDLLGATAGATRVLLGESTHGTHEYYRERARISERLIREQGFNAVAVEGDWTPIWRLNQYVRGLGNHRSAEQAMAGLTRFPVWMWRNREFADFAERLRALNLERAAGERVGLYGMDVYDLYDAADAATAYLRRADTAAGARAERSYDCFDRYDRSTDSYGRATQRGASCRKEAEAVLAEMRRIDRPADAIAAERHFAAVRSAASVVAAEEYFRTAFTGSMAWNVRDQRMAQAVEDIAQHVEALSGRPGKVVMWSHNTHSGDARATFAADRGELNLGQLMRQRHGQAAFLVGYFSYEGTVMAAPEWGAAGRVYDMRPALPGSYSTLFRETGLPAFSLLLRGNETITRLLRGPMLERAIGVVYLPQTERLSHYFDARLSGQFDAAVYFDRSRAVTPIR